MFAYDTTWLQDVMQILLLPVEERANLFYFFNGLQAFCFGELLDFVRIVAVYIFHLKNSL